MTKPDLQNNLFEVLCEHLGDQAICLLDEQGYVAGWNAGAGRYYHLTEEAVLYRNLSVLFDEPCIAAGLASAYSQGRFEAEWRLKPNGGDNGKVWVSIQPLYHDDQLQGYSLYSRSLLYSKKAGDHLTGQQVTAVHKDSLFQQLIEHSYSGISLFDADLNFIYRSPSAARITGFNNLARMDVSVDDMIHPADQPRIKSLLSEVLKDPGSSRTCLFRSRHFEGHFIDLECVFTNWLHERGIEAVVLNFRDVSEQQKAQARLDQAIKELSVYKYALDEAAIVAVTDQGGRIIHVNDYFCRISGFTREELLGRDHRLINSGHHAPEFIRELWQTIAAGRIWRGELRNRSKDGGHYWVATTIVPFLNDHGKPYQYMAIRYDITALKLADEALQRTTDRLGNLLESINDGFIALDAGLHYTYVNSRVCSMVGRKAEDMLGKYIWDLFPDAVGSATYQAIDRALKEQRPIVHEDYYPPLELWQENRIYPNENGISIFISDITERKNAELRKVLLNNISTIFNGQEKMGVSLQEVLKQVLPYARAELAQGWLTSADGGKLYLVAHATGDNRTAEAFNIDTAGRLMAIKQGLPGQTWHSGEIMYWQDLANHPLFVRKKAAAQAGLTAAIGIPLSTGGETLGVLVLGLRHQRSEALSNAFLKQLAEHLSAEIKRRQLKRELQRVFDNVPDIICIIGTDRRYKRVNTAMCQLLGYTEAELLQKTIDELIYPGDLAESKLRMQRFKNDELDALYFENRYLTRAGALIHLAWTVRKAAEKGILFCVAKDVTEKKKLEELLQKSNELARIGSWALDPKTGSVYWSPVVREVLEVPGEYEMEWLKADRFCGPEALEKVNSAIGDVIASQQTFDIEIEVITARGNPRWVRILGEGEFLEGVCTRVYGSFQDIDSRKRADLKLLEQAEELVASGRRYSELFHISPLPMFVFDLETLAYLDVNEAAVRHYGYSREAFLQMTIRDIRPETELKKLDEVVNNLKRRDHLFRPGIFTHRKKDGEEIQVEIISSALNYFDRPARLALALDVTERNRYLAEIEAQNQRLKDISWMQSHIIRAPLSRLMGLVYLLRDTMPDAATTGDILQYIQTSADELDQVIRNITENATGSIPLQNS